MCKLQYDLLCGIDTIEEMLSIAYAAVYVNKLFF